MTDPILIAGFHRSGTSAAARALSEAGMHLGDELLGAEPANPYGHFEDLHVIDAHDAALDRAGLTWKSPTAANNGPDEVLRTRIGQLVDMRNRTNRPWAVKDPRLCLFLGEWLSAAPTAKVVVVFRRPADAIVSLHRRHVRRWVDTRGVDPSDLAFWETPDLGLQLWIHYHEQLLASLPTADRVHMVNFSNRASIECLPATVAELWSTPIDTATPVPLDPALGAESTVGLELRDPSLLSRARHVWDQLLAQTPNCV